MDTLVDALGLAVLLSALLCAVYIKVLEPYFYYFKEYSCVFGDIAGSSLLKKYSPVILVFCTVVFAAVLLSGHKGLYLAGLLITAAVLLVISATDIRFKKIPNEFNIIILLLGAVLGLSSSGNLFFPVALCGGAAASLLPAMVKFLGGSIGAGDIKLMFSVGFLLGTWLALSFFLLTFIFAAVVAVVFLFFHKIGRKTPIPLAPFACIAFSAVIYFEEVFTEIWRII